MVTIAAHVWADVGAVQDGSVVCLRILATAVTVIDQVAGRLVKLVGGRTQPCQRPALGNCQGMLTINADDDDEHLKDFEEYRCRDRT